MTSIFDPVIQLAALGGPVLVILMIVSVGTLAVILHKTWQYRIAHVGQGAHIRKALSVWDTGDKAAAREALTGSKHFLAPIIDLGMRQEGADNLADRLESEAEQKILPLEKGFRVLDTVAQLAPLLGLLGTVLGMIEAFQALQAAGSQVDPSVLAGGIWVALITTAAGLSVAMPTSMALSWFEARIDTERALADHALKVIGAPSSSAGTVLSASEKGHGA